MVDRFQANYDDLRRISMHFDWSADEVQMMLDTIKLRLEYLRSSWQGKAADAFFTDMDEKVLPGIRRLERAMDEAAATTRRSSTIIRDAEEQAANQFKYLVDPHFLNPNGTTAAGGSSGGGAASSGSYPSAIRLRFNAVAEALRTGNPRTTLQAWQGLVQSLGHTGRTDVPVLVGQVVAHAFPLPNVPPPSSRAELDVYVQALNVHFDTLAALPNNPNPIEGFNQQYQAVQMLNDLSHMLHDTAL
jgi:WXG100 family type VII secretion target